MSSTVTLLKTSAITAITADLTAAVASSASAASSSASAASSSASAASSSATAAASSAASASSSAASAANAIANTYKGGVAGGSVPATSALAGDYYRITAEGTAQSKTWAAGDLAIYNGTSGSWTQIVGYNVDLATLAAQRNALAPAQALSFNGTAGSTLTLTSTPSGDQTWAFDVQVPVSNPAAGMGIFNAGGNYGASGTFGAFISVGGLLTIDQFGATGSDYREATSAGFVSAYAGTVVRLIIKLSRGALSGNPRGAHHPPGLVPGASPPAWGASLANGTVYLGKMSSAGSYLFTGTIRPIGIENYALSTAQETYVYQTGSFPASDYGASGAPAGTTVTAGAFVIGKKYRIVSVGTTSFTGIGASANTVGVEFTATGVGTGTGTAIAIGLIVCHDWAEYAGGPQVIDVSGNGADLNLPGDGVSSGVVPTLPGATPSPFRATRTSSGYLIGDQVVIPPGCSVEIWAKGNGTFSLGDSSGTPASIVNAQTAPTNLSPIAQGGYVTATRKLYLTLGSATSVTVRVNFKSA